MVTKPRPRLSRFDGRRWPDLNDGEKDSVLDWIVSLCLVSGASRPTAYRVAAEFAHGMEPDSTLPGRWR